MTGMRAPGRGTPLDDEEVESADAPAAGWLSPATAPAHRSARRGHRVGWRLIVVGVALVAAVGFLLYEGIGTSLNYYVTVRQALAERASLSGRTVRLQGIVVPGTIRHHGTTVAFTVAEPGDRRLQVPVVNHGIPPQLFKKGIPVIVQGTFSGATFVSDQLLVDHTGNYLPQRDGPRNASSAATGGKAAAASSAAAAAR